MQQQPGPGAGLVPKQAGRAAAAGALQALPQSSLPARSRTPARLERCCTPAPPPARAPSSRAPAPQFSPRLAPRASPPAPAPPAPQVMRALPPGARSTKLHVVAKVASSNTRLLVERFVDSLPPGQAPFSYELLIAEELTSAVLTQVAQEHDFAQVGWAGGPGWCGWARLSSTGVGCVAGSRCVRMWLPLSCDRASVQGLQAAHRSCTDLLAPGLCPVACAAQVVEELLARPEGNELYLLPIDRLGLRTGEALRFADVAELARLQARTALGLVRASGEVSLAPGADSALVLREGDKVVVLAQDGL
jgi:hypothetical protein